MPYVIINSKNLSGASSRTSQRLAGLNGPLRSTIQHLSGRTGAAGMKALGGLGDVPLSDAQARGQIQAAFLAATQQWVTLLNQALNDMPLLPLITMSDARKMITDARDAITNSRNNILADSVQNFGVAVIQDTSIPIEEVAIRVRDFLVNYLQNLQATVQNAQQTAKLMSMQGLLQSFEDACLQVLQKASTAAGKAIRTGLDAATGELPVWVLPAAGIAAVLYFLHATR